MRQFERFYTIQEVASLTRRSVGITKTYASKLGLGKRIPNRGGKFFYTYDEVVKVLLFKTSQIKSTKKEIDTKKAGKNKPVMARKRKTSKAP